MMRRIDLTVPFRRLGFTDSLLRYKYCLYMYTVYICVYIYMYI